MELEYATYEGFQNLHQDRSVLTDDQNRMRTSSLFLEVTQVKTKYEPLYSMRDTDGNGLPSAYLIYMTSTDEYDAATKLVGSMRHWRKLLECEWFMKGIAKKGFEGLEQWREDMMMRDASQGKQALVKQAGKGDTSAARKLVDMAKPDAAPKVGRPGTKAAKKQAEKDTASNERKAKVAKLRKKHEAKHGAS